MLLYCFCGPASFVSELDISIHNYAANILYYKKQDLSVINTEHDWNIFHVANLFSQIIDIHLTYLASDDRIMWEVFHTGQIQLYFFMKSLIYLIS